MAIGTHASADPKRQPDQHRQSVTDKELAQTNTDGEEQNVRQFSVDSQDVDRRRQGVAREWHGPTRRHPP
jgi:hypothetical protein